MKRLLSRQISIRAMTFLVLLTHSDKAASQVFNGDLTLTTQAQVDAFAYSAATGTFRTTLIGVNVALGASVTLGGSFFIGGWSDGYPVDPTTVVDGVFLPRATAWNQGPVWWDSGDDQPRYIDLSLAGTFTLDAVVVQADDNDAYLLYYWDLQSEDWALLWDVPNYKQFGDGMQTRPNPANDTQRYSLPTPIETNALRLVGKLEDGDNLFAVGEIQAFGVSAEVPKLISPGDGAAGLATSQTLKWTDLGPGARYDLQVAVDGAFAGIVYTLNLPETDAEFVAPVTGRTYYWRVRALFGTTAFDWVGPRSFSVGMTGPLAVALLAPADKATNQNHILDFSWTNAPEAVHYHLQVSEREDFATAIVNESGLSSTTYRAQGLAAEKTFFWRVAGVDGQGRKTFTQTRSFTTVVDAPSLISLLTPEDKEQHVSRMTSFSWQAHPAADTYQLQLATDAAFTNVLLNDSTLTNTTREVTTPLDYGTAYYWRVRGRNAGGDGAWSEVRSFTTIIAAPGAIALLSPEDGATEVMAYTAFSWASLEDAAAYHLQVGGDTAFSAPFIDDSTLTDPTYAISEPLAYSTSYYWHVRAALDDGLGKSTGLLWGPWSETRSFTIGVGTATEGEQGIPTVFALHAAYPNPFNPATTLTYDLPQAANVKLVVFDGLGRVVESLVNSHQSLGRHTVTWGARGVPSGVYFVRMEAGTFQATRRTLLVK